MNALLLICLLAVAVAGQSLEDLQKKLDTFESKDNFKLEYNRIDDTTFLELRFDAMWRNQELRKTFTGSMTWILSNTYSGRGISDNQVSRDGVFCILTSSKNWSFLRYRPLTLLFDGTERIKMPEGRHDGTVDTNYGVLVRESVCWPMPLTLRTQLAVANTIEFQYGRVQGTIRKERKILFEQYASFFKSQDRQIPQ